MRLNELSVPIHKAINISPQTLGSFLSSSEQARSQQKSDGDLIPADEQEEPDVLMESGSAEPLRIQRLTVDATTQTEPATPKPKLSMCDAACDFPLDVAEAVVNEHNYCLAPQQNPNEPCLDD